MTTPTTLPLDATATAAPRGSRGAAQGIFLALIVAVLLAALAVAVKTWGLVALSLTALALVPVCFALLILISLGK